MKDLRTFSAVILAAGASARMGQQKLLLAWGGTTVIGHIVEQWQSLVPHVAAVVRAPGDDPAGVAAELQRVGVPPSQQIVNVAPQRGMFSSVCAAAAWPSWPARTTHFIIILGDQPHLDRHRVLAPLLAAALRHPECVVQPGFRGSARHPVVLPRRLFSSLAEAECQTLREALAGFPRSQVPFDDPLLDLDLDTTSDYEYARRVVFAGGS